MTTLAKDSARAHETGDQNDIPVVASDIIYGGAAVGIVTASGHARPLAAGDKFAGFAVTKADNSAGSAADIKVKVRKKGQIQLSVTGALITDVGQPVYATDDDTFGFLKTSGVFVGFVKRFVSAGVAVVEYDVDNFADPHDGLIAETHIVDYTVDALDTGKVLFVTVDAKTITLPAVAGLKIRVVNGGGYGLVLVTISPNANDGIKGPDMTATDDKDLLNTKATANRGDYVDLEYADATGWMVTAIKGTWAKEA